MTMTRGLTAIGLTLVLIATLWSQPGWTATASTTITVTPGNSAALRVTPTSLTLVEDVVAPGGDWTFRSSPQPWFPTGVSQGWVFGASGGTRCATVSVLTFKESYTLTASATMSGDTAPLAVYLADAGSTCATPAAKAVQISMSSGSPTTLATGLSHSLTKYYSLLVVPVGGAAVSRVTTITLTWAVQ